MRYPFPEIVEAGRDRVGRYATRKSQQWGRFLIRCPQSRRQLVLLFSGEMNWINEGRQGPAWEHLSISVAGQLCTPTWEEMTWAASLFWDDEEVLVQYRPAKSEYVNCHPGTLHWFRPCNGKLPMPPAETVGPLRLPDGAHGP